MSYLSCMARVTYALIQSKLLRTKGVYEYCGYSKEAQGPFRPTPTPARKSGAVGGPGLAR